MLIIKNKKMLENDNTKNEALSIALVISSFFKKFFRIHYYKFQKTIWGTLKGSTKYHLSITFFNKWNLNFRIMNQDNSFFFRNEELYSYLLSRKNRNLNF